MEKQISRSKIEWCTHIDTSIVGCNNNCGYCYGRKMVKPGFLNLWEKYYDGEIIYYQKNGIPIVKKELTNLFNYKPVFLHHRYSLKFPYKPAVIFMNPLSDISDYTDEWVDRIANKINEQDKGHVYIFLTKNIYDTSLHNFSHFLYRSLGKKIIKNVYIGMTFTKYNSNYDILLRRTLELNKAGFNTLWSLEPSNMECFLKFINIFRQSNNYRMFPNFIIWGQQKPVKIKLTKQDIWKLKNSLKLLFNEYNKPYVPFFFKGIKEIKSDAPQDIKNILISWGKGNEFNIDD